MAPKTSPDANEAPIARRTQRYSAAYPESRAYRLKNKILGPPLVTEQLGHESLANPVALGVLAPDMISSSAYGTEQMLIVMLPIIGLGAFTMVIPITIAIIAVLFFVTLSYLEILGHYTTVGGTYIVARDNFGTKFAQVAAVALLIDYTVTVAVQTSAGTVALDSAFPALVPYRVPITLGVICLLLIGNLRGIKEAGAWFAMPVYFFILALGSVIVVGFIKHFSGSLHHLPRPSDADLGYHPGTQTNSLLMGLGIFYLLKAFANGGASLTGLEAVSDSIGMFRHPRARNGRQVLVTMCVILGFLVIGTSLLANWTHAFPFGSGSPSVVSQEVRAVLGSTGIGHIMFLVVHFATVAILYTGANTSFNGFPYLASFVASDHYLPRQLGKRGHRLAFSNGIIVLTAVAIVLVVAFNASVNGLVSLYALGVFTGFTIAGAGMSARHWRKREGKWKLGLAVNGLSFVLSLTVVLVLMVTKFGEGAWIILVVAPPMFFGLLHLRKEHDKEEAQLVDGAVATIEAPVLRRHMVVVFVDRLDMATARAIQYAKTLHPDDLRAIHFNLDPLVASTIAEDWSRLGISRFPLDVIECRDRRLDRASIELVAEIVADEATECTVLLPRRVFNSRISRILHDRTADKIADALSTVPHVAATIVPFNLNRRGGPLVEHQDGADVVEAEEVWTARPTKKTEIDRMLAEHSNGTVAIGDLVGRKRAKVAGRIRSMRIQPGQQSTNLEVVVTDDTGDVTVIFMGRPEIPGIEPGTRLVAEAMVAERGQELTMTNPVIELISGHGE